MSLRHPLLGFVGRRLFLGALTLLLVSIVVFAATQILPGDAARAVLGRSATPERLQILRLQLHLDRPALTQYWIWLSGLFAGDLGTSLVTPQGIYQLAAPRIANSFSPAGHRRRHRRARRRRPRHRGGDPAQPGLRHWPLGHSAMAAVPESVIGIGLIIVLPVASCIGCRLSPLGAARRPPSGQAPYLVLPTLTL
jgi:peptide/nickel transport system permease protein